MRTFVQMLRVSGCIGVAFTVDSSQCFSSDAYSSVFSHIHNHCEENIAELDEKSHYRRSMMIVHMEDMIELNRKSKISRK
jgi:hypothetical protein